MKARLPISIRPTWRQAMATWLRMRLVVCSRSAKRPQPRKHHGAGANLRRRAADADARRQAQHLATDYRPIKDGYMVEFRDNQFNVISELLRGS